MAKKVVTSESCIRPGYKQMASKRCKEEGCMGKPKDLKQAETFDGTICNKCWAVHEFKPEEVIVAQERLEMEEGKKAEKDNAKQEKLKNKTLVTSEKELEKLIKEADAKEKKKVKKSGGEQLNLL